MFYPKIFTILTMQTTLDFTSRSPINKESLTGQNKKIFEWLEDGNTINCVLALRCLSVMHLHSRISDLRQTGVVIYDRFIKFGEIKVKEYSLKKFD